MERIRQHNDGYWLNFLNTDANASGHWEIGGRRPEDYSANNKNSNLATIDHVIPLSKGGNKYDESNLVIACKTCNKKKGSMSVEEFLISMKKAQKSHIF
jgi:5-methylcytosine-specific restriction endonuclease McrA